MAAPHDPPAEPADPAPPDEPDLRPELDAARQRRLALGDAMTALERVAASPAGAESWPEQLAETLSTLQHALERHIAEVEQPAGLLSAALDAAPRLVPQVERLRLDHDVIADRVDDLDRWVATPGPIDPAATRHRVMVVLGLLADHRQRGADLVYEAYAVDIGGG